MKEAACTPLGRISVAMLVGVLGGLEARAQLAITEVMSWASTNCPGCESAGNSGCRPDFWELTNFGTNAVDLRGYLFVDEAAIFPDAAWRIPTRVIIQSNESIIFLRSGWAEVSDAAAFVQWWGEAHFPANPQIICCYLGLGFNELGDAVRLFDPDSNVVDQVYFGETRRGFTFDYDTETGAPKQSELDMCGAFQAALCDDVGSPGSAPCGAVPLRMTRQPASQTNDAGTEVTFHLEATGLPRPRGFQWYFNGAPLPSMPAGQATVPTAILYAGCGPAWTAVSKPTDLTIHNVQPGHAGHYYVVVTNGLQVLTSAVATLTVNTKPMPPALECPPAELRWPALPGQPRTNLVVAPLQTATLGVLVRAYPPPRFRWSWSGDGANFVDLPGATNRMLVLPFVSTNAIPGHAGLYRVRAQNTNGVIEAFARLIVKSPPRLKITEAMTDECSPSANDWWEVTNIGDEPADLSAFRWDDFPGNIGGGPTLTNFLILQQGESVLFLEGQSPESFTAWWGADNLPPGQQFVMYAANGLSTEGDAIRLWTPTATDDDDWVDRNDFAYATRGASFWFDTFLCLDPDGVRMDTPSVSGQCGAFRSAQGCDVGSPGWTRWTPPRLTDIRPDHLQVRLDWKAQPGSTTRVQYTRELASPAAATVWTDLGQFTFPVPSGAAQDTTVGSDRQRFYRVTMVSPDDCPCPPSP